MSVWDRYILSGENFAGREQKRLEGICNDSENLYGNGQHLLVRSMLGSSSGRNHGYEASVGLPTTDSLHSAIIMSF